MVLLSRKSPSLEDFFVLEDNGMRIKAFQDMKNNGSLDELLQDMLTQFDLLNSKYSEERGGYSAFIFAWSNWIYNLVLGEDGIDPVILCNAIFESELSNLIHWIGWKVLNFKAMEKKIQVLEDNRAKEDLSKKK